MIDGHAIILKFSNKTNNDNNKLKSKRKTIKSLPINTKLIIRYN